MSFVEVEFDEFDSWDKTATKFKKTICTFEMNLPDSFYNAILYGLIFKLSKNEQGIDKSKMLQIVEKYFLKNYMIKKKCSSLICLCNFEKKKLRCQSDFNGKKTFFKCLQTTRKFRHIIQKGVQGKNKQLCHLMSLKNLAVTT